MSNSVGMSDPTPSEACELNWTSRCTEILHNEWQQIMQQAHHHDSKGPNLIASTRRITINAFVGPVNGNQQSFFFQAVEHVQKQLNIEFVIDSRTVKDIRIKYMMDEQELVDWLLDADIHICCSHVHQGSGNCWNMSTLYEQMKRLAYHPGFPSGEELSCPVFTQDKFIYLTALGDLSNPTLKIPRVTSDCSSHHRNNSHLVYSVAK